MSAVNFKIELEGFEKVKRKLDILLEVDRTKHRQFKNGIKKASKIYIKYMKQELNGVGIKRKVTKTNRSGNTVIFRKGALKKSIAYIPSRNKKSLIGYIGPRQGKRAGKTFDGYYASIVNTGANPGGSSSKALGFANRAYDKGKAEVQKALEIEVARILNKTILQLANS